MKILVTGGAGYLGSILVPDLLAAGHEVTVLDNFMFRQGSLNHVCYHPRFSVVKGDIRVESTIKPLLQKTMRSFLSPRWSGRRSATRTRWAQRRPTATRSWPCSSSCRARSWC